MYRSVPDGKAIKLKLKQHIKINNKQYIVKLLSLSQILTLIHHFTFLKRYKKISGKVWGGGGMGAHLPAPQTPAI
jgi:hypothetical protein